MAGSDGYGFSSCGQALKVFAQVQHKRQTMALMSPNCRVLTKSCKSTVSHIPVLPRIIMLMTIAKSLERHHEQDNTLDNGHKIHSDLFGIYPLKEGSGSYRPMAVLLLLTSAPPYPGLLNDADDPARTSVTFRSSRVGVLSHRRHSPRTK